MAGVGVAGLCLAAGPERAAAAKGRFPAAGEIQRYPGTGSGRPMKPIPLPVLDEFDRVQILANFLDCFASPHLILLTQRFLDNFVA